MSSYLGMLSPSDDWSASMALMASKKKFSKESLHFEKSSKKGGGGIDKFYLCPNALAYHAKKTKMNYS
ncbi:MAG: hypothetical protein OXC92_04585 [Flavobacteriaceae bacterium]|nr:hypothetical protein [Flavobacteriaceae bacterium]